MATNIRPVELLEPEQYVRSYQGVVVKDRTSGALYVNVMGNVLAARWSDPLSVAEGDTVLVQMGTGRTQGLGTCIVVARLNSRPRPARGTVTVVPPSSETVSVQGDDGVTYIATFGTSYTPVVNDKVVLSWTSATPNIISKISITAPATPVAPPAPVAPPPPAPVTGSTGYWATDSNTYWPPGGWGSWAGGRGRVYQGNYGSGDVYGAYFYNGAPTQLQGRTITGCSVALGSRIAAGSYNSPVTVHIYATSNSTRPGGNITTVGGPIDVTAWPGQGLTRYSIGSLAGHLLNGGGIAILGNPYAGFLGIPEQPDAGSLIFDWRM